MIEADAAAYARLSKRRWSAAWITLGVTLPIAAAILFVEYRLMIFAIILLVVPFAAVADAVMVGRASKRLGFACDLSWDQAGVTLEAAAGTSRVGLNALRMLRVQPDAVIVVERLSATAARAFVVPATPEQAAPLVAHLERLGVAVQHEKQLILGLLAVLGGAVFYVGAGKVAAGLVLAGLLNLGHWAWTRTGSPWLGIGLFTGGVALLTLKVLLLRLLPLASGTEPGANEG